MDTSSVALGGASNYTVRAVRSLSFSRGPGLLENLHESCGVFGVFAPGEDVARITFFGLFALQHRGQESAGIATANGSEIRIHTSMGLVNQAFDEPALERLTGHIAIGHTRYSTTGTSRIDNAQPIVVDGAPPRDPTGAHLNAMHRDLLDRLGQAARASGEFAAGSTQAAAGGWR